MNNRIKYLAIVAVVVVLGACGFIYKDTIMGLVGFSTQEEFPEMIVDNVAESSNDNIPSLPQVPQTPSNQSINTTFCNGDDCISLAKTYINGDGVAKDSIEAIKILIKPCEEKNADACALLADIYENGYGVEKSSLLYLGYANKACDLGSVDGCFSLGKLYYRGVKGFIVKDTSKAFALFKDTCDKGKVEGCHNLAVIYNNGDGVKKNLNTAKSLFDNACKQGHTPSCENLKKISL